MNSVNEQMRNILYFYPKYIVPGSKLILYDFFFHRKNYESAKLRLAAGL